MFMMARVVQMVQVVKMVPVVPMVQVVTVRWSGGKSGQGGQTDTQTVERRALICLCRILNFLLVYPALLMS